MADLMPYERLVPCLLDRLTDEEPTRRSEGRQRRVISPRRYLQSARNDLRNLLNTGAHALGEALYDYPEVATSVVNYGIPDLCGMTASGIEAAELEHAIRRGILAFEPRLVPETLEVRVFSEPDEASHNALAFEIVGELWAQPAPEAFYVKTEVDLETGQWEL
ncbi:MAG: type VI secretion system baseplate subunit TssE [Planctomycetota bacterium]